MKRFWQLILCVVVIFSLSVGCPANPDPPDDDDDDILTIQVTGILEDVGHNPMQGFLVIGTDAVSGKTYTGETGIGGAFTICVPTGKALVYAVVDDAGRAAGVFRAQLPAGTPRDGGPETVPTGIIADEALALGTLTVPNLPGGIEVGPAVEFDTTVVAKIDPLSENLLGFTADAEFGKGEGLVVEGVFDPFGGKADIDGDGLPNVVDADDDGDGIPDDWDETPYGEVAPEPLSFEYSLGFLLDIRENSGIRSYYSPDPAVVEDALRRDMRLDFRLRFTNPSDFAKVRSVKLFLPSSPVYAKDLDAVEFAPDPDRSGMRKVLTFADGSTFDPGVNAMAVWSSLTDDYSGDGYNIPLHHTDPNTFSISVKIPVVDENLFEVGDVFTVEVIDDVGNVTYHSQMLNYVYSNVTHFVAIDVNDTATAPEDLIGFTDLDFSVNDPNEVGYEETDTHVHFLFIPPKDESGAYIIPAEDGTYDSGFRIEMFTRPDPDAGTATGKDAAGVWSDSNRRYDDVLSNLPKIVDGGDTYFVGTIPLEYIEALVDMEDVDPTKSDLFEMEYFLNVTGYSYIKNRLAFKANDSPMH